MPTKPDATNKKEFKLVPAGTHLARCYQFIHIGHVPNTFKGAEGQITNKIRLTWELPEELEVFKQGEEAKPFSVSQEYTLSMNEKANLRKMVQSWTGVTLSDEEANNFDAESLVGMDCLLTVTHVTKNDKTFANIQNITKLPSKMVCPASVNASKITTWPGMTKEEWATIPKFLQDKMKLSEEYKKFALENNIEEVAF